jgi:hypothetical protein
LFHYDRVLKNYRTHFAATTFHAIARRVRLMSRRPTEATTEFSA